MQIMRLALLLLIIQTPRLFADTAAVLPFANRTAVTNPTQASLDWIGRAFAETVRDAHRLTRLVGRFRASRPKTPIISSTCAR